MGQRPYLSQDSASGNKDNYGPSSKYACDCWPYIWTNMGCQHLQQCLLCTQAQTIQKYGSCVLSCSYDHINNFLINIYLHKTDDTAIYTLCTHAVSWPNVQRTPSGHATHVLMRCVSYQQVPYKYLSTQNRWYSHLLGVHMQSPDQMFKRTSSGQTNCEGWWLWCRHVLPVNEPQMFMPPKTASVNKDT